MKNVVRILCISAILFSACSANQVANPNQVSSSSNQANPNVQNSDTNIKPKNFNITDSSIPVIKPSNLVEELRKKNTENPDMTAKELADYGNELLKKHGYDYTFDWQPKGKANEATLAKTDHENYLPFKYEFTDATGKQRPFQLMNDDFGHPCFSVIEIPITKVNERILTIVSDGKEIELKRPKDFELEEFVLVDNSLKKTIRTWQTPIDATPLGISEDGKKVYFESWQFYQDETDNGKESVISLAVEVSEDGSLKLIDVHEIKSDKGVDIDYDKQNTEIIYRKYKVGSNEYIIKYSSPCT